MDPRDNENPTGRLGIREVADQARQKQVERKKQLARDNNFQELISQQEAIQTALVEQTSALLEFHRDRTYDVKVTNQEKVESVKTPDVKEVTKAIKNLEKVAKEKEIDLSPLIEANKTMIGLLSGLPKAFPKVPDFPSEIKINNLTDALSALEDIKTAIAKQKLDPKIEVQSPEVKIDLEKQEELLNQLINAVNSIEVPEVNVPETDLKPLIRSMVRVEKAVSSIEIPIPNPTTAAYKDSDGVPTSIQVQDGKIPTTVNKPLTLFDSVDVSERVPIIELKSNYGVSALRDITSVTGSGAVTNDGTEYNLSTGATTGSTATLSSAERGRYTPGAQGQAGIGVRLDETLTGTSDAKWGYFDDDNGFGFGVDSTGIYVFTRRAGTDTKVHQANWNGDKLNGSGASGLTLALNEGNIFHIDFSWYGYGTIAFRVALTDSKNQQSLYTAHRFSPSQQTSIANPNQPISATVTNGDTTNDLDLFVGGRQFSIFNKFDPNRRINSQYRLSQSSVGTTFLPAISFRRKSAFETVSVKIAGYDIITDGSLVVQLRVNTDLTNASYGTPTDTSAAETACEVDTSATAVSGGELVYESLISVSGGGAFARGSGSASELYLDIPAIQPVTLCIRTITSTATVSSILRWREEW